MAHESLLEELAAGEAAALADVLEAGAVGEEDGLVDDFLAEAALLGAGDLDLADGDLAGLLPRGAGDLLRPERLALLFGGIARESGAESEIHRFRQEGLTF
jgi:hypothetical protein